MAALTTKPRKDLWERLPILILPAEANWTAEGRSPSNDAVEIDEDIAESWALAIEWKLTLRKTKLVNENTTER